MDKDANPFIAMSAAHRALLVGVLIAYFATSLILRANDPAPTNDVIPYALAAYLCLLAIPFAWSRMGQGWLHPLVVGSLFSVVGLLRKLMMYSWGLEWHRALPLDSQQLSEVIGYSLWMQCVAVLSYYAGYLLPAWVTRQKWTFAKEAPSQSTFVLIAALGAGGFLAYAALRGGIASHVADWSQGRHDALSGQYYQLMIAHLGVPGCLLWLAYHRNAARSVLFWGSSALTLMVLFLATGSRGLPIYVLLAGMLVWMLRVGRVAYTRFFVAAVCAIYALTVLGEFRRSGWGGGPAWDFEQRDFFGTVAEGAKGELSSRVTTSDGLLPILARVPEREPMLYGSSYVAVIVLPIPRSLWPEKPGLAGGRVGRTFFGLEAGVPPSAVGEAYWNFHIPGVIGVFLLFGLFHRRVALAFARHRKQGAAIVLYVLTLVFWRDPSGGSFVGWALLTVPSLIVAYALGLVRVRRDSPRT